MDKIFFVAVIKGDEQLLNYTDERIEGAIAVVDKKLREFVSIDGFHDNVQVGLVEKILLNLDDVGMIEVFEVFDFFDGVDFLFFLDGDDFADSLDFADSMDDFANETGRAAIDDFGKVVKLEDFADVIFDELAVAHSEVLRALFGSG